MDKYITLKIAEEFSRIPGVRERIEGSFPGEEFLEKILFPKFQTAVAENKKLLVDLDGAAGYPTSFLEASFGGLTRRIKNPDDVLKRIDFISKEDPFLIGDIQEYIHDALNATA